MYKIIEITPFGIVFEIENDLCFNTQNSYDISINNQFYKTENKNVVSIFGLKSNKDYNINISGLEKQINFDFKTERLEFLINVKKYNASGDGINNDTSPINFAIYSAPENSTIYFPSGTYLVDQILLKSNINIYLEKGATIIQNTNRKELAIALAYQKNYDHSDVTINASWEGHPIDCYASLIFGKNVTNVHIYGDGTIDGNGSEGGWWNNPKIKNIAFRPKNISLNYCKNIKLSGFTTQNSASWNIHPFYCENLSVTDLKIKSLETSPNTDGLNPESCENVSIVGCHFSVGDDCIALKAGKFYMSVKHYRPTKNVEVRNCFMEKGHGGLVIGSEISCGVQNVLVTKCLFKETDRGLRIKTRRGRGEKSVVDGITFQNIQMEDVKHGFVINMYYFCDPDGKSDYVKNKNVLVKDDQTPTVKNISIKNVIAKNIKGTAIYIYGLSENKVDDITIKNSYFSFADNRINELPDMLSDVETIENLGVFMKFAQNIKIENTEFVGDYESVIE